MINFNCNGAPEEREPNQPDGTHTAEPDNTAQKADSEKTPSQRRVEANRRNAQRSTGPRNTEWTRLNATKHGLRAHGLTRFDNHEEYAAMLDELSSELPPLSVCDRFIIENMALGMVRSRRAACIDADLVELMRHRPSPGDEPKEDAPMLEPLMVSEYGPSMLNLAVRYRTSATNEALRFMKEFERRRDENGAQSAGDEADKEKGGGLIN